MIQFMTSANSPLVTSNVSMAKESSLTLCLGASSISPESEPSQTESSAATSRRLLASALTVADPVPDPVADDALLLLHPHQRPRQPHKTTKTSFFIVFKYSIFPQCCTSLLLFNIFLLT